MPGLKITQFGTGLDPAVAIAASSAASSTPLGGDLSGTPPTAVVTGIGGVPVDTPSGVATDYLDGTGHWSVPAGAGGSTDAYSLGSLGATHTVDHANGTWQYGTLTANCTLTLSPVTSGKDIGLTLELLQDGTGGWAVTWPGSVVWLGGSAPTFDTTLGTTTIVGLLTRDGGTTWVAGILGGSGTGGTPATTVTDETTFGITPAVGVGTEYARQGHTHGSPSIATLAAAGHWEPVTNGNVSTPEVVFEAGDLVMQWVT